MLIEQPDSGVMFQVILFLFLLLCSGLISASEVAYFTLNIKDIKDLEESELASSKRALTLKERPRYLLATILISNNFVNIAIVIVAEGILRVLLGESTLLSMGQWLHDNLLYNIAAPTTIASAINFLITVVGVTFILVLFGEAMPKIYATLNKMKMVNLMAAPLSMLMYLLSPISNILVKWSSSMEKSLGVNAASTQTSKEDIDTAIDLTVNNDSEASVQEADILKGIVNFGDTSAKQIMRPRMDIVGLDDDFNFKEVMKVVKDSGYSRLPVFHEELDKIIGILYVKDLLAFTEAPETFAW